MGLRNLGENLHEVESPVLARLGRVAESIKPGLKLIKQHSTGGLSEHCDQQVLARNLGTALSPHKPCVFAIGVTREQQIPQSSVAALVQGLRDHMPGPTEGQVLELGPTESVSPISQPQLPRARVVEQMIQRRHQMRLSLTPVTDERDGSVRGD